MEAINRVLGLELDEGDVVMPVNAQRHAQRRHPDDFGIYFPHVASVVQRPLYVRDDFKNDGKIELIGRPEGADQPLLVAVEITKDADGRYNITSFYPISDQKVAKRRESGHLRVIM